MYITLKKLYRILLFISVILFVLNFHGPTWSQSFKPNSQNDKTATSTDNKATTESPSDLTEKGLPEEPKRVDQIGQKVGHEIDDFSQKASSWLGAWINTKAFYGITWLKLILSLLMLFVVLLIERIVRLTIDRRRRRIEE